MRAGASSTRRALGRLDARVHRAGADSGRHSHTPAVQVGSQRHPEGLADERQRAPVAQGLALQFGGKVEQRKIVDRDNGAAQA